MPLTPAIPLEMMLAVIDVGEGLSDRRNNAKPVIEDWVGMNVWPAGWCAPTPSRKELPMAEHCWSIAPVVACAAAPFSDRETRVIAKTTASTDGMNRFAFRI